MARSLWVGALALSAVGLHWFLLALAALGAPPELRTCSHPCPPLQHDYGWRTVLVFLPETVMVAGLAALVAGGLRTWRHMYILTGLTAAAILIVAVVLLANPSLVRAAPPDPFFNAWR